MVNWKEHEEWWFIGMRGEWLRDTSMNKGCWVCDILHLAWLLFPILLHLIHKLCFVYICNRTWTTPKLQAPWMVPLYRFSASQILSSLYNKISILFSASYFFYTINFLYKWDKDMKKMWNKINNITVKDKKKGFINC